MKVGFFQYDVVRNRDANLEKIALTIENKQFDLLVLPELFTSGYAFDTKEELIPFLEELSNSPTVDFLTTLAKKTNACFVGSIAEVDKGKIYNTAIAVDKSGLINHYRKTHLPDYEKRFFTAGNTPSVFDFKNATIASVICFDCWFAPLTSALKIEGAQIICHPSCFGGAVTPTIIPIRALENQNFFISCNRVGIEYFDGEEESYRGESQIVDPDGNIIYKAVNQEELAIVDINLAKVSKPDFGSFISSDFKSEHGKYSIKLND